VRKIDIAHIVDTGNVRKTYTDIEELATSIEDHGLLQPVSVKALVPDGQGFPRYELVAGFRRWKAFQLLHEQNKGFAMIDAILVTGDKLVLQLVENLQRSDLSAREREEGIALMCESGIPKGDVAKLLSKSLSFVSRNVGAYAIRKVLDDAGIDTSGIDTTIIYALHKIADNKYILQNAARQLIAGGGTKSVAERIIPQYEANRTAPAETENDDDNSDSGRADAPTQPEKKTKETKVSPKKPAVRKSESGMEDDFPETFPEKLVRFDEVAEAIYDYIERAELHKSIAGKEILTLLYKRLCND
jgi:ParB/RepB/Spo0J family partition protein